MGKKKKWRRRARARRRGAPSLFSLSSTHPSKKKTQPNPQTDNPETPIIRLYGVTAGGHSVTAFLHGFEPYFFAEAPPGFGPDDCDDLARALHARLAERHARLRCPALCTGVSIVPGKASLWQYTGGGTRPFLRIGLALPSLVAAARGMIESGFVINAHRLGTTTYESNVLYPLRFMVDAGVVGGNWVALPAGSYRLGPAGGPGAPRATHCQVEASTHYSSLISHAPEGEWARLAPLRVLSVDIECAGRKGHFPEPAHDPVIQIASLVSVTGSPRPAVRNILTLDTCAPIAGAEVMSFSCEKALLRRWRDLVIETDPDIIIG
jgi:DNA polymerase delta subunit 1